MGAAGERANGPKRGERVAQGFARDGAQPKKRNGRIDGEKTETNNSAVIDATLASEQEWVRRMGCESKRESSLGRSARMRQARSMTFAEKTNIGQPRKMGEGPPEAGLRFRFAEKRSQLEPPRRGRGNAGRCTKRTMLAAGRWCVKKTKFQKKEAGKSKELNPIARRRPRGARGRVGVRGSLLDHPRKGFTLQERGKAGH